MESADRHMSLKRKIVQGFWGLLSNAHLSGFITGKIYTGPLKKFCVPGMNCYACPGALGACPIGSMQAMLSARHPRIPFYVLGFLMAVGVAAGRLICGWLCLFGLIQEILYKIPVPKIHVPEKADQVLRYLKYVMLVLFAVLLPIILRDEFGMSTTYFCKWICPVGTLEGGIPLVLLDRTLRQAAHLLFAWKTVILVVIIGLSMTIYRPFCKYICPLGAFYALFQKISFVRLRVDTSACVHCGKCERVCKMNVDPVQTPNSAECIRCGDCVSECPQNALYFLRKTREHNNIMERKEQNEKKVF